MLGETVKIKLYKAIDGVKEFIGILNGFDGNVKLDVDGKAYEFALKEISKANIYYCE